MRLPAPSLGAVLLLAALPLGALATENPHCERIVGWAKDPTIHDTSPGKPVELWGNLLDHRQLPVGVTIGIEDSSVKYLGLYHRTFDLPTQTWGPLESTTWKNKEAKFDQGNIVPEGTVMVGLGLHATDDRIDKVFVWYQYLRVVNGQVKLDPLIHLSVTGSGSAPWWEEAYAPLIIADGLTLNQQVIVGFGAQVEDHDVNNIRVETRSLTTMLDCPPISRTRPQWMDPQWDVLGSEHTPEGMAVLPSAEPYFVITGLRGTVNNSEMGALQLRVAEVLPDGHLAPGHWVTREGRDADDAEVKTEAEVLLPESENAVAIGFAMRSDDSSLVTLRVWYKEWDPKTLNVTGPMKIALGGKDPGGPVEMTNLPLTNGPEVAIGLAAKVEDSNFVHLAVRRTHFRLDHRPPEDPETALLQKHAPIVYLHPNEEYHPSSVDWMLARSRMEDEFGNVVLPTIPGQWALHDRYAGASDGWHMWLKSESSRAGELYAARAYGYAKPFGSEEFDLHYWFFYPYNGNLFDYGKGAAAACIGPQALVVCPLYLAEWPKTVNVHEGDWEHIVVRTREQGQYIEKVYMAAHSGGEWFAPGDLEKQGDQVVVYSAKSSHATYEREKETVRLGGFANDYTKRGVNWNTRNDLVDVGFHTYGTSSDFGGWVPKNDQVFLKYSGRWGRTEKTVDTLVLGPVIEWLEGVTGATLIDEISDGPVGPAWKGSGW